MIVDTFYLVLIALLILGIGFFIGYLAGFSSEIRIQ